jgi:hypothetical protein
VTVCACLTAALLAPALAGAGRPPVSLVASPAHVALAGKARGTIHVTNSGLEAVVVDVTRTGFAFDLRGRPRIVPRGARAAASWLAVRPRRLTIEPGGEAALTVASTLPRRAEPGDHGELVLLTTRPVRAAGIAVRMRIGVVVVVRAPGKVVRRLSLLALRARRAGNARMLELLVANRGNVTEALGRGCVTVSLLRGGRVLVRLHPAPRELLPRTRGIVELRYAGPLRGWVRARVELSRRASCGHAPRRTFPIRL